mmetsp:Transcript_3384/g.8681  ORF Transcript_3384/g.8681 Transcript_3384/m.8681 type:complete len:216 (-) Transcript_3384:157-804(-)
MSSFAIFSAARRSAADSSCSFLAASASASTFSAASLRARRSATILCFSASCVCIVLISAFHPFFVCRTEASAPSLAALPAAYLAALSATSFLKLAPASAHVFGHSVGCCHSSLPSQQSQTRSLTRLLKIFALWYPLFLQKNVPLVHADVPGSSEPSRQSQKSSLIREYGIVFTDTCSSHDSLSDLRAASYRALIEGEDESIPRGSCEEAGEEAET